MSRSIILVIILLIRAVPALSAEAKQENDTCALWTNSTQYTEAYQGMLPVSDKDGNMGVMPVILIFARSANRPKQLTGIFLKFGTGFDKELGEGKISFPGGSSNSTISCLPGSVLLLGWELSEAHVWMELHSTSNTGFSAVLYRDGGRRRSFSMAPQQ